AQFANSIVGIHSRDRNSQRQNHCNQTNDISTHDFLLLISPVRQFVWVNRSGPRCPFERVLEIVTELWLEKFLEIIELRRSAWSGRWKESGSGWGSLRGRGRGGLSRQIHRRRHRSELRRCSRRARGETW